jgi:hypothetical protein
MMWYLPYSENPNPEAGIPLNYPWLLSDVYVAEYIEISDEAYSVLLKSQESVLDSSSMTEATVISLIEGENMFGNYKTQKTDDNGTTLYVGQVKSSGEYLLSKTIDTSGDLEITYANLSNNLTFTTFDLAWTDRATLTYALISELTGV